MKVKELGEFGLISLLAKLVAKESQTAAEIAGDAGFRLLLGIGDDAAAWRNPPSTELFTTDTMVEGVHFVLERIGWRDLGWKIMAANYSDIAAMGGTPLYSIITLGLRDETSVEGIVDMYRGMLAVAGEYGGAIVGGDVVRSPTLFVTAALTGATEGGIMTRSAARPGDQVAVTGSLGSSAGGLRMILQGLSFRSEVASHLLEAHHRPRPRIAQARILKDIGVLAAMDISDGLVDDLSKICQASGVEGVVHAEKVPMSPLLEEAFPTDSLSLALGGGEDYELLLTAPDATMKKASHALDVPVSVIGEIISGEPGRVTALDKEGHAKHVPKRGWNHFG
ncbi:MAG: thiamine-phosphate kinase [Chloroflexi bacterium]|nr:thiamine-phosphate kinase [Chloroflexota bacterium]